MGDRINVTPTAEATLRKGLHEVAGRLADIAVEHVKRKLAQEGAPTTVLEALVDAVKDCAATKPSDALFFDTVRAGSLMAAYLEAQTKPSDALFFEKMSAARSTVQRCSCQSRGTCGACHRARRSGRTRVHGCAARPKG